MPNSYPYTIANGKIDQILAKIRSAAKPPKFTYEFLKQLGFSSSNDRAILQILKGLGFLTADGTPTEYYDRLRDNTDWQFVLGERMSDLYKDLFNVDLEIHKASDAELKGAIARVTGKDATSAGRYAATFKALASLAKFDSSPRVKPRQEEKPPEDRELPATKTRGEKSPINVGFSHTIQIQLPATTDVSVYNAIFKAIRENLLDE